jgi:hypothetical protein
MAKDDRSTLVQQILHSLERKKVSKSAVDKIHAAIAECSIRPLRVLYECCVSEGVSTEELTTKYGYNQPPRAARDLRELGFNLKTKFSKTTDGRRMAIYYIDDFNTFSNKEGRKIFSKVEKTSLFELHKGSCYYCMGKFSSNELQIDHRIPFEIAGNTLHEKDGIDALILVCSSCNRSKSWSCESCANFTLKDVKTCLSCYWYVPDSYSHISCRKAVVINTIFYEGESGFKRFLGKDRASIKKLLS